MEVKDVVSKVNISEKENASVERFLGSLSSRVNLLLDMEPYKLAAFIAAGKNMHMTPEELLEDVELLADVYSVMKKSQGTVREPVYKGVTDKQCKFFSGQTREIISTSLYEEDEKSLESIIRFNVDGEISFLDGFVYGEEGKIVLPPFAKIKSFEYVESKDGIKVYDATLVEGDASISDDKLDKKEELREYIIQNFAEFKEYVSSLNVDGKIEFDSKYAKANKFNNAVRDFTSIACREKELDIVKVRETVNAEIERVKQEVERREAEDRRLDMISGMRGRINSVPQKFNEFFEKLGKLKDLLEAENRYVYYAAKLGIPYSRRLEPGSLNKRIEAIRKASDRIKEKVSGVQITDNLSEQEAEERFSGVRDLVSAVEGLRLDVNGIEYLPHIFDQGMTLALKEKIDRRAFDVIKRLRIQKYKSDLDKIPEKPNFWSKLTGKAKIEELQRQNLKHKIELERLAEYAPKRLYSINDTLSDLYAEQQILGLSNHEIIDFGQTIDLSFSVNQEDVKRLTNEKVSKSRNLPTVFDAKKVQTRKQADYLAEVNDFLAKSIEAARRKQNSRAGKLKESTMDEGFLTDNEIFESVDKMLKSIESKTVALVTEYDRDEKNADVKAVASPKEEKVLAFDE